MEPARLRAVLARTPGLAAGHLQACLGGHPPDDALPADLLARLLETTLPGRTRAWLECPDNRLIDSDLRWIEANDCQIVASVDSNFPAGWLRAGATPATVYVQGSGRLLREPALAVVGSGQASAAGIDTALGFSGELARAGLTVASGLGAGIDAAAHEGALAAGGRTIALCATGLDQVYPAAHARLAARIRTHGVLVSVFAPGTPLQRYHFPLRNRLLGALAAGALVVEATAGSGALSIAQQVQRLGKPLFAIPGSIRDPAARCCNQLIRDGATLVQRPCEILQKLRIHHNDQGVMRLKRPAPAAQSGSSPLDNNYEMLLDAAGFEPVDIDVLAFRTGWSGHTVASMLLLLELQGRVAPQPGGRYCRLS